ncbi:MAG: hypothetical protein AAGN66_27130 [Acidobacteriota bacterium]
MSKLFPMIALMALLAASAAAVAPPASVGTTAPIAVELTEPLPFFATPFWQQPQQLIGFFCPPNDSGPFPCTVDAHCFEYNLGPNARCHNPSGGSCTGQCTC